MQYYLVYVEVAFLRLEHIMRLVQSISRFSSSGPCAGSDGAMKHGAVPVWNRTQVMKTSSQALYRTCQGLSGIGILGVTASALAAPTGVYFEQEVVDQTGWLTPDARQLVRVDVYLTFDNTSDHLNAVNGQTAPLDLTISTSDPLGFYQTSSGHGGVNTTATRNSALEAMYPSMTADSWVTIGLTDQTGNAMLDVGIDFTNFNSGGSLTIDNGAWFVTPPDAQGDATNNSVLIGRFTHAAGFSSSATLNFQYVDAGSGTTEEVVGVSCVYRGAKSDLNGDGQSDILWRGDYGAGGAGAWEGSVISWTNWDGADLGFDSGVVYNTHTGTPIPEEWIIAGTGDMDGNGRDDIVWRNDVGSVIVWLMDDDGVGFTPALFYSGAIVDWRIAGIGDFDGDGQDDILWQAEYGTGSGFEGAILAWEQWDGTDGGYTSGIIFGGAIPSTWVAVGTADLNGNGRDGVVWRNPTGSLVYWDLNGWTYSSMIFFSGAIVDWSIKALGDFDGDGQDDVLWQADYGTSSGYEGSVLAWEQWDGTDGGYTTGVIYDTSSSTPIPDTWTIVSSGDMLADGMDDVVWRNPDGAVVVWDMDGWNYDAAIMYSGAIAGWSIDSPRDIYNTGN